MRTFLSWFNARRRLVALALLGLVTVGYLSAGRTPNSNEWFQIPDLGMALAIALGLFAAIGLIMLTFARSSSRSRRSGEVKSLRALLILAIVVAVATQLFGPEEFTEVTPVVEQEQVATPSGGVIESSTESEPAGASGADIVLLTLILLVIAAGGVRRWRTSPSAPEPSAAVQISLTDELAPAIEEVRHHLSEELDPRTAVLTAYASLEYALADLDRDRQPSETPSEHMARVLADIPALTAPAIRLGELYEIARYSHGNVTEEDRREAVRALDRARKSLALAVPSQS